MKASRSASRPERAGNAGARSAEHVRSAADEHQQQHDTEQQDRVGHGPILP